ncbi:15878_t:CDS:2, partial [Gigaspora rosea]
YQCNKNDRVDKKERQRHEAEFNTTGKHPICFNCEKNTGDMFEKDEGIIFPPGLLLKGTSQENLDYILKIYGKCKIHHNPSKNQYCKCSLFDLNNLDDCKICTIECCKQRKKELLDEEGSGPFEFGRYRFLLGSSNETVDKINNIILENYEKQKAIINNNDTYYNVVSDRRKWPTTFVSSPQNLEKITYDEEKLRKKNIKRRWWPIVFYFYGLNGSGKSGLVTELFGVEHKGKGFRQPFIPKYIFMTARKSLQESYNFGNRSNNEDSCQRNDDITKRTTQIKFHKDDEMKFRNFDWDVKLRICEDRIEKTIEECKKINNGQGIYTVINNEVYWKKEIPDFKKQYLLEYPKVKPLFKYKQEFNNRIDKIELSSKHKGDNLFYSALLLIKNKPTPIPQSKNNDRTNDTTTTYTETASTTTLLTTIKPDFDFPKRLKDLLTSKESTTNSTTTRTFQKSFIKRFYI